MTATVRYLLAGFRCRRLFLIQAGVLTVVAALAVFFGGIGIVEKAETSIVLMASFGRIALVAFVVLAVSTWCASSFELREIHILVSRPIGRDAVVVAHVVAFLVLAWAGVAQLSLLIWLVGETPTLSLLRWTGGIAIEAGLTVCLAVFVGLSLASAVPVAMIAFAWYVLSRLQGTLLAIAATPAGEQAAGPATMAIRGIAWFLPRLDLGAPTSILLYGPNGTAADLLLVSEACVYAVLLVLAACFDFRRRSF